MGKQDRQVTICVCRSCRKIEVLIPELPSAICNLARPQFLSTGGGAQKQVPRPEARWGSILRRNPTFVKGKARDICDRIFGAQHLEMIREDREDGPGLDRHGHVSLATLLLTVGIVVACLFPLGNTGVGREVGEENGGISCYVPWGFHVMLCDVFVICSFPHYRFSAFGLLCFGPCDRQDNICPGLFALQRSLPLDASVFQSLPFSSELSLGNLKTTGGRISSLPDCTSQFSAEKINPPRCFVHLHGSCVELFCVHLL